MSRKQSLYLPMKVYIYRTSTTFTEGTIMIVSYPYILLEVTQLWDDCCALSKEVDLKQIETNKNSAPVSFPS